MVVLNDIQRFDAECVNPPLNVKSEDWLKSGFAGAKCDTKPAAAPKAADKKPAK